MVVSEENIKSILDLDYINGNNAEIFFNNITNESIILSTFQKVYFLSGVKSKKNRLLDYNMITEVGLHLISLIDKWNSKSIIQILLDIDDIRDTQNMFMLNCIDYLVENYTIPVSYHLIALIENVSHLTLNFRENIANKSLEVLEKLLKCSNNSDLDPFIPVIVESLQSPEKIPKAIEKLAGCVFVQNVEFRALAVILPILEKGLKHNITENKRKTCIIITNMCKLVDDPKEVYPLMPVLYPLVSNCITVISDPEARNIAERTLETLKKSCGDDYQFTTFKVEDMKTKVLEKISGSYPEDEIVYFSQLLCEIANCYCFNEKEWLDIFTKYLKKDKIEEIANTLRIELKNVNKKEEIRFEDTEEGQDLYKGEFSLAYGALTLLNNTYLHLKRNRFYGLLGPNNCGKTTLMRAIANEQVENFPKRDELKTIFVEHEIQEREVGKDEVGMSILNVDLCGIDWVVDCCNEVYQMEPKVEREDVEKVMEEIGFGNSKKDVGTDRAADAEMPITTYSGGWKMKMQLCAATLMNADILMLDEPTGHLDVTNVQWLKDYLSNFMNGGGSIICTSHDSAFLDEMCSHIIDFQNRKLVMFRDTIGNVLKKFVKQYPEKKGYFELKNDVLKFVFPVPSPLEGKKSQKTILKMKDVTFQYPIRDKPTVFNISLTCSLSSRVAVIGANGAGKSTAIKLLIGELKPTKGEVWKNINARIAYVAQHAFQHLEKHLDKTPTQYILWRFAGNDDKESLDFKAGKDEEEKPKAKYYLKTEDLNYVIVKCQTKEQEKRAVVVDRFYNKMYSKKNKCDEYEISFKDHSPDQKMWVSRDILLDMGISKKIEKFDEKMALISGLIDKTLTGESVEKHLRGFGIEPEQASHTLIGSLSGGQKVKVVLAASLWQNPHLIILDEPTNYLDRDGLGALTKAIHEFKGGVIIISHNQEFANSVAQEKWIMEKGHLRREGESTANMDNTPSEIKNIGDGTIKDKYGNVLKMERTSNLDDKEKRKEIKRLEKLIKKMQKSGALEEDIFALEDKLDALRN